MKKKINLQKLQISSFKTTGIGEKPQDMIKGGQTQSNMMFHCRSECSCPIWV